LNCYLCRGTELKVIKTKLRHNIKRNVFKCKSCGLVFLEPKELDFKDYYNKEYRKLYTPVIGKALSSKQVFDIYLPFQQKRIDEIKEILNKGMRVLEIGCSAGFFLYALKNHVKECVGIEFNKEDAKFVNEELGIKVYTESIENTGIPQNYFDIVIMHFVLEHLNDPIKFLKTISKYLKDSGYIYIKVPNIQDSLLSVYHVKAYSDFWFREPHIYYFSSKTLLKVVGEAGFTGDIKTVQEYNFINQLNWILTGKPQRSADIGMSEPVLVTSDSAPPIKKDFNEWMQKVNKEYIKLLNKHDIGESILFIGKKRRK